MTDDEYRKILKQYHKLSDRHILVVETDMPYSDALKIVALSDKIRKAGNELVSLMRKNYEQLMRTKRCGFTHCGTVYVEEDEYPRLAFEKVSKKED